MLTVMIVLVVLALITCILAAMNKCPGWAPIMLLCIWALIKTIPVD